MLTTAHVTEQINWHNKYIPKKHEHEPVIYFFCLLLQIGYVCWGQKRLLGKDTKNYI